MAEIIPKRKNKSMNQELLIAFTLMWASCLQKNSQKNICLYLFLDVFLPLFQWILFSYGSSVSFSATNSLVLLLPVYCRFLVTFLAVCVCAPDPVVLLLLFMLSLSVWLLYCEVFCRFAFVVAVVQRKEMQQGQDF